MDSYFRCHIAPVMSKTRTYLTEKQGEEMMEYSTSPGGILSLMASSMQPLADPYQVLKATGEWNSKTTEDYIEMCKAEIAGSEAMQQDLAYMAERWREAVVQEVGRERYDELSRELGCDLAYAFVDYRVEQLMIGRLVEERMPRSSSEYIIRKAAESSLLGLTQTLSRSPLAEEIENNRDNAEKTDSLARELLSTNENIARQQLEDAEHQEEWPRTPRVAPPRSAVTWRRLPTSLPRCRRTYIT